MLRHIVLLPLFFFTLVIVVLGIHLFHAESTPSTYLESALLNKPLPKISLPTLANQTPILISEIIPDRPYLLIVWATWCANCWQEHHYLKRLAQEGVTLLGLNYKDDRQQAQAWLKEQGDPYYLNVADTQGIAALELGIYGAPEIFIIDREQIIRYRYTGTLNETVWQSELLPIWQQYQ